MKKTRLWDKGEQLNLLVNRFTVSKVDLEVDQLLLPFDCLASAAHARMLEKTAVITAQELNLLLKSLQEIIALNQAEKFPLTMELEDCHTAIESYLIEKHQETGRKIHTGRSRNDQVLVAMRLFLKDACNQVTQRLFDFAHALENRIEKSRNLPMPGYTHLQAAMPASIGMWLQAFYEQCLELITQGRNLYQALDQNPLGAAAGFGVPMNLDRDYVSASLGFAKTQRNPIYVQNSRGRFELQFLRWQVEVALMIEKLAIDLQLYHTREFGFIKLGEEFTTGSSIMPQKRNPDVLELLRARCSKIKAYEFELLQLISKLPSNYHRDFQYTKAPVFDALSSTNEMLAVFSNVIDSLEFDEARLKQAMTAELYATYDALREVKKGVPFRDAYKQTALNIKDKLQDSKFSPTEYQSEYGFILNNIAVEFEEAKKELNSLEESFKSRSKFFNDKLKDVLTTTT